MHKFYWKCTRLLSLVIFKEKYITQKGIKLGSSKKEVIDVYGENYYEREDTGEEIIGYFDKTKKVNIEFAFRDDLDLVMVYKIDWKG